MPKKENAKSDSAKSDENNDHASQAKLWRIAVIGGLFLVALLLGSVFIPNLTERVKFFTVNALSVLVLVAIVVQAYIYTQQWRVMERQVKVAERNVKIAEDAFYVGEAPYFGISEMSYGWMSTAEYTDFRNGSWPQLVVTFLNGGKTPAWHFSAIPTLVLGSSPEDGESFSLRATSEHGYDDSENRFYPSGTQKRIKYRGEIMFTPDMLNAIFDGTTSLFLLIGILYRDMRDERYSRTFSRIFNPKTGRFVDC